LKFVISDKQTTWGQGQMLTISKLRQKRVNTDTSIELASILFFDIETTGLRPDRGAKIIQVAILNRSFRQYLWSANSNSEICAFPLQLPEIFTQLRTGIIVGHNLPFDFWFISYEADKLGIDGPILRFIDTLSLARKVLPGRSSYKLVELLKYFDINVKGELHTAKTDAEATRALFWKLIEKGGISTAGEAGMKKINWTSF
jgi:DNA polymerase III subunit epsilon